jgi:hypothetical protein
MEEISLFNNGELRALVNMIILDPRRSLQLRLMGRDQQ